MKTLIVFVLVVLGHSADAVTHSMKYFYTSSSGVPNFPEFVVVGYVDEVQFVHFDSNTKREEPKQEWMNKVIEEDPEYSQRNTEIYLGTEQVYKNNIEVAKQRFNQTGGTHIFQYMYGCEWDDETNEVKGYSQYGYDGEDFIVYDQETETWIAPRPQAVITKHKWDTNKAKIEQDKHYFTQICPEFLKKYVNYGRNSLLRTERPSVSLLQKTSSSPISCHATGFYPDRASLFWRKDGEELHEDVDLGEILPNHDGTFQMSVDLKLSVPPEDHKRYQCVFQLSGMKEDIITKMENIRSNEGKPIDTVTIIIYFFVALAVVAVVVLAAVIGVKLWRRRSNCRDCQDDGDKNSELSKNLKENPES